jgi:hypothetical protein
LWLDNGPLVCLLFRLALHKSKYNCTTMQTDGHKK